MNQINKKILGITVALMAVAMLVLSMSVVYATKPDTITGGLEMKLPMVVERRDAGKSNNKIAIYTDSPVKVTGGMEGEGGYTAKWLMKFDPPFPFPVSTVDNGVYLLDVTIDGKRGELKVGIKENMKLIIVGGTGGLKNLHGTGQLTYIPGTFYLKYTYSLDIHFNPNS